MQHRLRTKNLYHDCIACRFELIFEKPSIFSTSLLKSRSIMQHETLTSLLFSQQKRNKNFQEYANECKTLHSQRNTKRDRIEKVLKEFHLKTQFIRTWQILPSPIEFFLHYFLFYIKYRKLFTRTLTIFSKAQAGIIFIYNIHFSDGQRRLEEYTLLWRKVCPLSSDRCITRIIYVERCIWETSSITLTMQIYLNVFSCSIITKFYYESIITIIESSQYDNDAGLRKRTPLYTLSG